MTDRSKNRLSMVLWIARSLRVTSNKYHDDDIRLQYARVKSYTDADWHGFPVQLSRSKRVTLMRVCRRRATSFESDMIYRYSFLWLAAIRCTDREMTEPPSSPPLSLSHLIVHTVCLFCLCTLSTYDLLRSTRSTLPIATPQVTMFLFQRDASS